MYGAQIEKLVAQCVPLFRLAQDGLQREGKFAQPRSLRPRSALNFIARQFQIRKQTNPAARAFFEACP